jgi:hypothetical protein
MRIAMIRLVALSGAWCLAALAGRAEEPWVVVVEAATEAQGASPFDVQAPSELKAGAYVGTTSDGTVSVPLLVEEGPEGHRIGGVAPGRAAWQGLRLQLRAATEGASAEGVTWAQGVANGPISVCVGGKPFATIVLEGPTKPYVDLLTGPGGVVLTRNYPMREVEGEDQDHPHQRSMWLSHGAVNGHDYWASDPLNPPNPAFGTQRVQNVRIVGTSEAIGSGLVRVEHDTDWVGPDGRVDCTDHRTLTFYASESPRFVDVDATIHAPGDASVTFGDTKEGTFGLRVASALDAKRKEGGTIRNAEGQTQTDAWGKPSSWVDYSGRIDGRLCGITIVNDPKSFRYPTTWHVRDYGLFAANPFGQKDFKTGLPGPHTIPAGGSIRLAYRVVLHGQNGPAHETPEGYAAAVARPPLVRVERVAD